VRNWSNHEIAPENPRKQAQGRASSEGTGPARARQPLTALDAMPDIATAASKLSSFDQAAD